jgi:hypothetical protein
MMDQGMAAPLRAWESFYVIVGSAGAALTGLQFVVMTLIGEAGGLSGRKETISAFGSPNVVHFCAALLVASILSAPWHSLASAGIAVTVCGVLGVVYSVIVVMRAHRQQGYKPVFEDWLWHTILPPLAYGSIFVVGIVLRWSSPDALFVLAAAVLLLVFIGIHNAWDTVTYMMVARLEASRKAEAGAASGAGGGPGAAPGEGSEDR